MVAGDRPADLTFHGGPDKAVYAYPADHLPRWNEELGTTFGPGTFGENLTTRGWLEDEVCIGDVWAWGDALLQVSRPRSALPSGEPLWYRADGGRQGGRARDFRDQSASRPGAARSCRRGYRRTVGRSHG